MASKLAGGSVSSREEMILHPFVIVSMSSYYSREIEDAALDKKARPSRVIGCLLGRTQDNRTDIRDIVLFPYTLTGTQLDLDAHDEKEEYKVFEKCMELALEVNGATDRILGWFSYGADQPTATNLALGKHLKTRLQAERFLFLSVSDDCPEDSEVLPLNLFEDTGSSLVKLKYKVEADDAEGVAMGHIEKIDTLVTGEAPMVGRFVEIQKALSKLQNRIKVIKEFLHEMKAKNESGKPVNRALLRKVARVMNQLPDHNTGTVDKHFLQDYNNAQLITYLAVASKLAATMGTLLEKTKAVSGGGRGGGDMMGGMGMDIDDEDFE